MRLAFLEARLPALCLAALTGFAIAAHAQVDPSGRWRTWHSEHFRIHAQAHLTDAAHHVAAEAERAYALLSAELDPPRGAIDLVVADNVDFANGFATPFPSNRLTLYVTPPTGTASLDDYDEWVRLVVTHELTHVFHLGRADGVWRLAQRVFGRAPFVFPNAYQPSWVKEGLATYYETRHTSAGRAGSGFHRQLLASAAPGHAWPAPRDLSLVSAKWPAGFGPYAWGAEFFAREASERGDSVIPGLVRRTSRRLWPIAVSGPLEAAGGRAVRDGWRELRERAGGDSAYERTVLVRGLRVDPEPKVHPRGERIAYVASRGEAVERVEVRSVAGNALLATRTVHGAPSLAWVADALVLAQLELTSPVTIRKDLYAWSDGGFSRLTAGARLDHPFATADGRVGAVDLGARASTLVVVAGEALQAVPAPPAYAWSRVVAAPDGRLMAGARHWGGRWEVVVWPPARPEEVRAVTGDRALEQDPAWSSDGELYFTSDRLGVFQVYRANVAEGSVVQVTDDPNGARQPAPLGGRELVYTTILADGFALVRRADLQIPVPSVEPERDEPYTPAPPVELREMGYRPWPALRPHYWVPVGHDEGPTGFFVGALTTGADAIGRTRYGARVGANAGSPLRPEFVLALAHSRWRRWTLDASVQQTWSGAVGRTTTGAIVPLAERGRAADLGITHAWRRWRSSLAFRLGAEIEETRFFSPATGTRLTFGAPAAGGGVFAFRAARVERPPLAISPENGVAVSGAYRHRWALDGSGTGDEVRGSLAAYLGLPLPGFAHWVVAVQANGALSEGAAAGVLGVGGVSSDFLEIIPGVTLGQGRRSFSLRGYPRASGFTRATSGVAELRIPLFLLGKGVWGVPLYVDRISVTLYGEVAGGWRAGDSPRPTSLRDVGGELVLDVGLSYDVPLRVRLGGAVPIVNGLGVERGDPRFYVAFGPSF